MESSVLLILSGSVTQGLQLADQARQRAEPVSDTILGSAVAWVGGANYFHLGDPHEAQNWWTSELAKPRTAQAGERRVLLLHVLAGACIDMGELAKGRACLTEANATCQYSSLYFFEGVLGFFEGEWERAEKMLTASSERSRTTGNRFEYLWSAAPLARLHRLTGERARALQFLQRALDISVEAGYILFELATRATLATMAADAGDSGEALLHLQRCRQIVGAGENWRGIAGRVERAEAVVAAVQGEFAGADGHFEKAIATFQHYCLPWEEADTLQYWGRALLAAGERTRAIEKFDAAIEIYRSRGAGTRFIEYVMADKMRTQSSKATQADDRAPLTDSIHVVAAAVARERPDLVTHAAPDGTVSILFTDIENSTAMFEKLGDLKANEIVRAHNAIIREQLAAHQGFEVKSMGDGFMLAFSSARRALLCAIEVQRAFETWCDKHPDDPIRVRIGLHTGEAIKEGGDFYGKTVILASRIAAKANGGEILVSSTLKDMVDSAGDLRFEESREVELQGLAGVHRIHKALRRAEDLVHQLETAVASDQNSAGSTPSADVGNVFRQEGDYWELGFEGSLVRVRDLLGLGYIAQLLRHPNVEFHALGLLSGADPSTVNPAERAEAAGSLEKLSDAQLAEANLRRGFGDAGEMLDAEAKAAYGRRLRELREEIEEARALGSEERAAKADDEIEAISKELARAVGLGGRDRRAGSPAERARLSVSRAIKAALSQIADKDPALARHLSSTMRTGLFCCYRPDSRLPISWQL